ncbi:acetyltransferase (GNAT) family protein [Pseudosporangium ferrugineum]|uniref:Acetyltransferase (GNAT) family protein n=1 Tax=Pseudosporangium ferrugineum TaxID=439699 RepID=A0A2T0RRY1_9ACTN|nr:acetyltransferase (GNAT) family protein [Pseudosporangium ferrugineum]
MEIELLSPRAATDAGLVAALTAMVNRAYADGEQGLWRDSVPRTSEADLAGLIALGEIAVARLSGDLAGLVRVQQLSPTLGEFGLLVAATEHKGAGVGRELVRFAEDRARGLGLPGMQLELLVPRTGSHPVKEFLRAWYTRLGYREAGSGELADAHPQLAPLLAVPCTFLIFRKDLQRRPAQPTQVRADGRAASRSGGMGRPQSSQMP